MRWTQKPAATQVLGSSRLSGPVFLPISLSNVEGLALSSRLSLQLYSSQLPPPAPVLCTVHQVAGFPVCEEAAWLPVSPP